MKYKLIKEYPRSPKLGVIVENQEFPHDGYFHHYNFSIKIEEITLYPEFWAKVTEDSILFTTHDGVPVFAGDKYYFITNGFRAVLSFGEDTGVFQSLNTFSTKEKADEFVIRNKPCLSLLDLLHVRANTNQTKPFPFFQELEEIVKSRL
jgi:hypothetical protein